MTVVPRVRPRWRTFALNDDTVQALAEGTAVVVVHGADPAKSER